MGQGVVRFAVTPAPRKGPSSEPFAAQLALARVHPCLVALERTQGGYAVRRDVTLGGFELHPKRGLAGYGLGRALRILLDVLNGLVALEDTRSPGGQPFVHGELVPAMVRLDSSGAARLIPLAPWHWSGPGTPPAPGRSGHLAPERLLGDTIDARADVFSAGVLLWEALAGRRLFETDSAESIVTRLMGEKVTLPQLPPELSWAVPLKAIAMCALSVDPEQRFANCAELAEAIEAVAGDRVATHADVASYFAAPQLPARPSRVVPPPSFSAHHSSLSALVAPVRSLTASEPSPSEPSPSASRSSASSTPERRGRRSVWAIAALSCLLSALGLNVIARYKTAYGNAHTASQSAANSGERSLAPVATPPLTPPPPDEAIAPPVEAIVPPVEAVAPPVEAAVAPESRSPVKPLKALSPAKTPASKLKMPTKSVHAPDKAVAKYGI